MRLHKITLSVLTSLIVLLFCLRLQGQPHPDYIPNSMHPRYQHLVTKFDIANLVKDYTTAGCGRFS